MFNVSIDFDLGEAFHESIDDTLSVTNNMEHILKLTNSVTLKRAIGELEFQAMKDSTALVYGFLSLIPPVNYKELHPKLTIAMRLTQSFTNSGSRRETVSRFDVDRLGLFSAVGRGVAAVFYYCALWFCRFRLRYRNARHLFCRSRHRGEGFGNRSAPKT